MSLSSFCVVTNALRLNWFRMHDNSRDQRLKKQAQINQGTVRKGREQEVSSGKDSREKQQNQTNKEETKMTKTMKIEGMMCGHCEARVKKCLEALSQVNEAAVSHETGTAVVTLNADIADEVLKKTVEDQDYQVTGIE